jgi:hypothetical protein
MQLHEKLLDILPQLVSPSTHHAAEADLRTAQLLRFLGTYQMAHEISFPLIVGFCSMFTSYR